MYRLNDMLRHCIGTLIIEMLICSLAFFQLVFGKNTAIQRVTDLVDPFWGSEKGNVFPGASVPFGMVKLGPDILKGGVTSGYRADETFAGFSHTHTSGTGGAPRYGNILFMPVFGTHPPKGYSEYKKSNEFARSGYYTVTLQQSGNEVRIELTASARVGFHRYTFDTSDKNESILEPLVYIDLSHTNTRFKDGKPTTFCTAGQIAVISETEIEGSATFQGGWGGDNPYQIYFVARFDRPFQSSGIWKNDSISTSNQRLQVMDNQTDRHVFGAFVSFKCRKSDQIQAKVAISYLSLDRARANLAEIPHWNFEQSRLEAEAKWQQYLGRIQVKGGTPEQRTMFYSGIRNSFLMPIDVTGDVPNGDATIPHYWDHYCIWDVFRTVMPLHLLIAPEEQRKMITSLLAIYQQKGWLPDAWIAGDYAYVQGGSNVDVVLADAVVKNLGGFDRHLAYQAMRKNATISSPEPGKYGRHLTAYQKYGFLPAETTSGAVSRSLEYAYNDFCISEVATILGYFSEAKDFRDRSMQIFSLFHDQNKLFWAKDSSLNWMPDFSLVSKRPDHWNDPYFYEGGSIIYSWYVPHAMAELIQRHGGSDNFVAHLDQVFDQGYFQLSNEPAFLIPYLYNYIGRQELTARRVRDILKYQFRPGNDGLPGQDDSGAISTWYVFSAIGIFPVAGQDIYLIGSPIFSEAVLQLENGKTFSIVANGVSEKNIFIQKAFLNGKLWQQNWLGHAHIVRGGKLVLVMGAQPIDWDGTNGPACSIRSDHNARYKPSADEK